MVLEEELSASDRDSFNDYVYLTLDEAVAEINRRSVNTQLTEYVNTSLPEGVPSPMEGVKSLVLFRHLATSNYEISRFATIADAIPQFKPLILEYSGDSFNDRNEWKHFLGKLRFYKGIDKNGQRMYENFGIINFNESNNKPISSIRTHWGESLVDFHHRLFEQQMPQLKKNRYDLSEWLRHIAPDAKHYYKSFFTLFLKDAILFENFIPDGKEFNFTKDVILPAIRTIEAETGKKPLIVALEPTEIEGDQFWLSHPLAMKAHISPRRESMRKWGFKKIINTISGMFKT